MLTFSGLYTPLITPFVNNELDEKGLEHLIAQQEEAAVSGIVILGTTGEVSTLTEREKERILAIASTSCLPLIVGCSDPSTAVLVEKVKKMRHPLLISAPAYIKPTQEGLYRHFAAAAAATDLPIILYNIPSRTCSNLEPETVERLAEIENIVAIKECNPAQPTPPLTLLAGNDASILAFLKKGATGAIASSGNLVPRTLKKMIEERSSVLHEKLLPLFEAGGIETNPIPCKMMLNILGEPAGEPRLPLLPCTKRTQLEEILWKLDCSEVRERLPKPTAHC